MTLRTSVTALGLFFCISSCSIREERQGCPCILTVDLSDASEDRGNVRISVWSGDDAIADDELNANAENAYSCKVPRGMAQISAMQGMDNCRTEGCNVTVPEGSDFDRIAIFAKQADCHGESAHVCARFMKNWVSLTIEYSCAEDGGYPFFFIITGDVCGFDMRSLRPASGNFIYKTGSGIDEKNSCTLNLPRQWPEGGSMLRLAIVRKSDGTEEHIYDLAEIMCTAGFDWNAESLDDFCIGLDYSGRITDIEVRDWESGIEAEPVI